MANIIKNSATKWNRKARLNVESALRFSASNKNYFILAADHPINNLGSGDFTINAFFSINELVSGHIFHVYKNQQVSLALYYEASAVKFFSRAVDEISKNIYIHKIEINSKGSYCIKRKGTALEIYHNGTLKYYDANHFSLTSNFTTANSCSVGVSQTLVDGFANIDLSHFALFNKALTNAEVEFIHYTGGVFPPSTHASCIAHYPLTQRYGKVAWDVVEQYNYAKTGNTVVANHADLINYTDLETGIPDRSSNTAWKSFYNRNAVDWINSVDTLGNLIEKKTLLPEHAKAIRFNGTDTLRQHATADIINPFDTGNATFIINFNSKPGDYSARAFNGTFLSFSDNSFNSNRTIFSINSNTYEIGVYLEPNSYILTGKFLYGLRQLAIIIENGKGTDIGRCKISVFINGVLVGNDNTLTNMKFANQTKVRIGDQPHVSNISPFSGEIASVFGIKKILTRKQILELSNNTLFANPSDKEKYNFIYNAGEVDTENGTWRASVGADAALSGFSANELNPLSAEYLVKNVNDLR